MADYSPMNGQTALTSEESRLDSVERKLASDLADVRRRELSASATLNRQKKELGALVSSPAGGLVADSLARAPADFTPPEAAPLPEREVARKARREAILARQAAAQAEHAHIKQRTEKLLDLEKAVARLERELEQIRAKAQAITKIDKLKEELERRVREGTPLPRPAPKSAPERRATPRISLEAQVTFSSDTNFYAGFSGDVSNGGIFVVTPTLLDLGTEVALNFTLPGGEAIKAHGVVRWRREASPNKPKSVQGLGIEFVNMSEEQWTAIFRFTAERDPMLFT